MSFHSRFTSLHCVFSDPLFVIPPHYMLTFPLCFVASVCDIHLLHILEAKDVYLVHLKSTHSQGSRQGSWSVETPSVERWFAQMASFLPKVVHVLLYFEHITISLSVYPEGTASHCVDMGVSQSQEYLPFFAFLHLAFDPGIVASCGKHLVLAWLYSSLSAPFLVVMNGLVSTNNIYTVLPCQVL